MNSFKKLTAVILVFSVLAAGLCLYSPAIDYGADEAEEATMTTQAEGVAELLLAEGRDDEGCGYCPTIVVPGITHSISYLADPNTGGIAVNESGDKLISQQFILDQTALIKDAIKKLVLPLAKALIFQRDDGSLAAAVDSVIRSNLNIQQCNDNGELINDIRLIEYNDSFAALRENEADYNEDGTLDVEWLYRMCPLQSFTEIAGEDHAYFFTFNLFGNPMEAADRLNDFIALVKEQTGHDKVNLVSLSLGGTIITAYCEKYSDTHDINTIVNVVSLLDGCSMASDLFARNFNLSDSFIYNDFLPMVMEESEGYATLGYVINLALRIFPKEVLFDSVLAPAYAAAMDTLFIRCPQWWAMVKTEDYPELADKWLAADKFSALRAKVDSFFEARASYADNVAEMQANGAEFNNICGYNLHIGDVREGVLKIVGSAEFVNSDGLIDIDSSSFGATYALPGERLDSPNAQYASPDGSIDASTCLSPNNTWFFYNMQHEDAANNAPTMNLIVKLLTTDDFNVNSDKENYPQFNGVAYNKDLRRWLLPDAKEIYEQYLNGELALSDENAAELRAAIEEGEAVLALTIADREATDAATARCEAILVKIGQREAKKEDSPVKAFLERLFAALNSAVYKQIGAQGYSDYAKSPFVRLLGIDL